MRAIGIALGSATAVAAVLGGAYWLGTTSRTTAEPAPASVAPLPAPSAPAHDLVPTAQASADPLAVARQWLAARNAVSWADHPATQWVDRSAPAVTGALAQQQETARDGGRGADWDEFVRNQCQRTAQHVDAVIPAEAPQTGATVYVQVTAEITTSCGAGPLPANETGRSHDSATVQADRQPDGLWRLSQRLY